mmetsp:Transcript_25624/g.83009  ORF Transcript_25624/g.83009 Transcript_25624/m.83009 type:complete len:386 (+) Transcript_25624:524-1681(+)
MPLRRLRRRAPRRRGPPAEPQAHHLHKNRKLRCRRPLVRRPPVPLPLQSLRPRVPTTKRRKLKPKLLSLLHSGGPRRIGPPGECSPDVRFEAEAYGEADGDLDGRRRTGQEEAGKGGSLLRRLVEVPPSRSPTTAKIRLFSRRLAGGPVDPVGCVPFEVGDGTDVSVAAVEALGPSRREGADDGGVSFVEAPHFQDQSVGVGRPSVDVGFDAEGDFEGHDRRVVAGPEHEGHVLPCLVDGPGHEGGGDELRVGPVVEPQLVEFLPFGVPRQVRHDCNAVFVFVFVVCGKDNDAGIARRRQDAVEEMAARHVVAEVDRRRTCLLEIPRDGPSLDGVPPDEGSVGVRLRFEVAEARALGFVRVDPVLREVSRLQGHRSIRRLLLFLQ